MEYLFAKSRFIFRVVGINRFDALHNIARDCRIWQTHCSFFPIYILGDLELTSPACAPMIPQSARSCVRSFLRLLSLSSTRIESSVWSFLVDWTLLTSGKRVSVTWRTFVRHRCPALAPIIDVLWQFVFLINMIPTILLISFHLRTIREQ